MQGCLTETECRAWPVLNLGDWKQAWGLCSKVVFKDLTLFLTQISSGLSREILYLNFIQNGQTSFGIWLFRSLLRKTLFILECLMLYLQYSLWPRCRDNPCSFKWWFCGVPVSSWRNTVLFYSSVVFCSYIVSNLLFLKKIHSLFLKSTFCVDLLQQQEALEACLFWLLFLI